MSIFVAVGCQGFLPVVRLSGTAGVEYSIGEMTVGKFSVNEPEYRLFGDYLEKYLQECVDDVTSQTDRERRSETDKPDGLAVEGELEMIHVPGTAGIEKKTLEARITFKLIDRVSGSTMKMAVLSGQFIYDQDEQVETVLRQKVNSFLMMVSPESAVVEKVMARGWSRYDQRGRERVVQGDYHGAIKAFSQAIDQRPDDHAALYNRGLVLEASGYWNQAMENYRRAWNMARQDIYRNSYERVHIKMGELNGQ